MKKNRRTENSKPELRRETLRQLDQNDLGQVAGGYYYVTLKACMGTWYTYTK